MGKPKLTQVEIRIRLDKYAQMSLEDKKDVWNVLYVKFNNLAVEHGFPIDPDYMSELIDEYEITLLDGEQYEVLAILRDFRQYHHL
jgi:hypothetical protein